MRTRARSRWRRWPYCPRTAGGNCSHRFFTCGNRYTRFCLLDLFICGYFFSIYLYIYIYICTYIWPYCPRTAGGNCSRRFFTCGSRYAGVCLLDIFIYRDLFSIYLYIYIYICTYMTLLSTHCRRELLASVLYVWEQVRWLQDLYIDLEISSLYIYLYICICICTDIYIYVCIYVYVYIYIYIYIYICISIPISISVSISIVSGSLAS